MGYVIERAFVREPVGLTGTFEQFPAASIRLGPTPWPRMRDGVLMLHRFADGAALPDIAGLLGVDSDVIRAALRDLAQRHPGSERLSTIFAQLADGRTVAQIAADLGLAERDVVAELEPTDKLTGAVCSALTVRSAVYGPPDVAGTAGPLRTLPVRFPDRQYDRLKAWCEANNFPMAVVVRGLVERFLDERAPLVG